MSTNPDSERTAAERLRDLQQLRDEGLITDEEFEERRNLVLDQTFGSEPPTPAAPEIEGGPELPPAEQGRQQSSRTTTSAYASATDRSDQDETSTGKLHPGNWPGWLRVTLIIASGLWAVTIPFMFWRRNRETWLPYAGIAMLGVLVVGIAFGDAGESDSSSVAPSTPVRTAEPTPVRTAEPTPTSTPPLSSTPIPPPSPPSLTTLDRQCLEWGRLTGNAGVLTEEYIRSEYDEWQRDVLPGCRALQSEARVLCREMRNAGLDPFDSDVLLGALVLFEVDPDQWDDIAAGIVVWCSP